MSFIPTLSVSRVTKPNPAPQVGTQYVARVTATSGSGLVGYQDSVPILIQSTASGFSASGIAVLITGIIVVLTVIMAILTCIIVRRRHAAVGSPCGV